MPGTSLDRVADVYDATRGGERRGGLFADTLASRIVGPTVVELGVGTGVIAHGLRRHDVAGQSLLECDWTPWDEFPSSVTDQIAGIEKRIYSSMFDVDDATWARVVEPVLHQLRALPEPDRPRSRRNRHPVVVWERTTS